MKRLFFFFGILFSAASQAQHTGFSTADIYLGLKKLNVLGSVLYVAAHPDDENTRLLSYLSKDKLYRTGYLSLTRGDGGQNLIGDEQGIELGLIRTHELLAARKIDGAEQFFTRAYDFGYSKTPEETLQKWDKEKILADVVWVIRSFRPDVIITRFPTTGEGGHGHHTSSAILANEAFHAAADPKRFPEQLKYVQPWQAKRILWNTFNFGGNNTTSNDQFRTDVGGFNPILGKSYGEISAESRSQHKSQGFGVPAGRGEAFEFFKTTGGTPPQHDLFDDIPTTWSRIEGGAAVEKQIADVIRSYDFTQPQKIVNGLVQVFKSLKSLPDSYWKNQKLKEVQRLIEAASGLWMEALASAQHAVQGDSIRISLIMNNRSGVPLKLNRITAEGFDSSFSASLPANRNFSFNKMLYISNTKHISQPYWLKEKKEDGHFTVTEQQLIGSPVSEPSIKVQFEIDVEGTPFVFEKAVQYKFTDPVRGEIYQPLFVIPAMTVFATPDVLLFQQGKKQSKNVNVFATANRQIRADSLETRIRSRQFASSQVDKNAAFSKNQQKEYSFTLAGEQLSRMKTDLLHPVTNYTEKNAENAAYLAMRSIDYDHIPAIRYFYADGVNILNMDLKTAGRHIGYIVGAGDKVPEALEQMGYEVTLLTEKELSRNNLQQFDAIITGVRAYNTNEWLNRYYDKLMKYVEAGGNVIVQYNTSSQIGPVRAKIGPYAFDITRNRITDENAPVTFIHPQHPVLNFPNKISPDDFNNWVQERSIYHAGNYDPRFQPILRMNDPGEKADDGSLIIAPHGRGFFTYTGLVFFRELPAAVPGAFRLLANLIALNQQKPM